MVEEKEKGRVYLDFILQLKNEVDKHGRTTQFWGDIILKYPVLIPEIPKDMIVLVWGYGATYPFDLNCKKFREAGCPFYVSRHICMALYRGTKSECIWQPEECSY